MMSPVKPKVGFKYVRKREGRLVPFDKARITNAILKAMMATGEGNPDSAEKVADAVVQDLLKKHMKGGILPPDANPDIEEIQDIVETNLILMDFLQTAKAYILYRNERAKFREQTREIPEHVKNLVVESRKYFRNSLAEFIYYRSYSRWIEKEGRRETWIETVDRFMNFMKEKIGKKVSEKEYAEIREAILKQEVMPSMRLMWSAGDAARKSNVAAYNCSFIAPRKLRDFAEIMYISMCGTGVGFSVEHQNVHALPQIKRQTNHKKVPVHVIDDSKEGWAEAFYLGLKTWFNGGDAQFDFSKIRPEGARLKTMGGKTSGPRPLQDLLNFTRNKIFSRQGGRLSSLDVHDIICKTGEIVVMGGVRRSALISLSDLDDSEMRSAKQGQFYVTEPQRAMANNSAVYNDKPSTKDFMDEWLALAKSGTGERGIFNRGSLQKQLPERRWKVFKKDFATCGTNPSLRADTKVLTDHGIFNIQELEGRIFRVRNLNGAWSPAKCFLSGRKQRLYEIMLSGDRKIWATKEHKWPIDKNGAITKVTTMDLKVGDLIPIGLNSDIGFNVEPSFTREQGFMIGWLLGDGWVTERKNGNREYGFLFSEREVCLAGQVLNAVNNLKDTESNLNNQNDGTYAFQVSNTNFDSIMRAQFGFGMKEDGIPKSIWQSNNEYIRGFMDGLFSSDGYVDDKNRGEVMLISSRRKILEDVAILLSFFGIKSTINRRQDTPGVFPNGKNYGRVYESYRLRLSINSARRFAELFQLSNPEKQKKLDGIKNGINRFPNTSYKNFEKVISIKETNLREDVWDITVYDDTHCFQIGYVMTGNCGEIVLKSKEFCNLSEVIARSEDTEKTLLRKIRLAAILGTYQSTLTNFEFLSKEWKEHCEEERLLGVSITGQWDCPVVRKDKVLRKLKQRAIEVNKKYAAKFGVTSSTCVTCVKPSGTVSQLVDASSGLHPRHAKYYLRRIRIAATDSLFHMLRDQKIPYFPEVGQAEGAATTYVIEFPVAAPKDSSILKDLSAAEQLEYWRKVKINYTEHNPSVTISVGEDEWLSVANWLYENWNMLGGLSFLPREEHIYVLAPYEVIDEETYKKKVAAFPEIDFAKILLYEKDDETEGSKELACVGGVCEI